MCINVYVVPTRRTMQGISKRCDILPSTHNKRVLIQIKSNLPTSAHFADTLFLSNCLLRLFRASWPGLFNNSGLRSSSIIACGLPIINDGLIIDRADIFSRVGDGMIDHIVFAYVLRRLDVSLE